MLSHWRTAAYEPPHGGSVCGRPADPLGVLILAESDAGTGRRGLGYGSGGVGGYIHDELGIEGHADPFQQRDGGHDAACF